MFVDIYFWYTSCKIYIIFNFSYISIYLLSIFNHKIWKNLTCSERCCILLIVSNGMQVCIHVLACVSAITGGRRRVTIIISPRGEERFWSSSCLFLETTVKSFFSRDSLNLSRTPLKYKHRSASCRRTDSPSRFFFSI